MKQDYCFSLCSTAHYDKLKEKPEPEHPSELIWLFCLAVGGILLV